MPRKASSELRKSVVRVNFTRAERAKLVEISRVQGISMGAVIRALLRGIDEDGRRLEVMR